MSINTNKQQIGDKHPCFIIAEAGSNHNGKLSQAKRLIDAAVEAKADAVKFQLFRAKDLYVKNAGESDYLKIKTPIYDIIKSMEMPYKWLPILSAYCKEKGIIFLAAVTSKETADKVNPFVSMHKIGSYESSHFPLLQHVSKFKKPIILSTGADNLNTIKKSLESLKKSGNPQVYLMQCTASYPAPLNHLNLKVIPTLKSIFKIPVGLSDHSRDPIVGPLGAVALGANLIEKHFTLDNNLPGPDHKFAQKPSELKIMVKKIREMEMALGSSEKKVSSAEKELLNFAKHGIQAIHDIKKGDVFSEKNIAVLRPGKQQKGISSEHWGTILGKKSKYSFKKGQGIKR